MTLPLFVHRPEIQTRLQKFSLISLTIYVLCSLTGMAPMNLSFGLVFLAFLFGVMCSKQLTDTTLNSSIAASPLLSQSLRSYRFWGWALFFACSLSLLVAQIWPYAYAGHNPEITLHGYNKIWYLLVPFVLFKAFSFATIESNADSHFLMLLKTWWWTTCALGLMAVIQFNTGWPYAQPIPPNIGHYHAILLFGHHLSTASIIPFPTFTALAIAIGAYVRNKEVKKLELSAGLIGILILFLSYARTAWLSIPIALLIIAARSLSKKQLKIALISLFVILILVLQAHTVQERLYNGMGIHERFELWVANIDYFKHRPLTGIGWLKTQEMSEYYFRQIDPLYYGSHFWGHAHNNFFEMLGGTGLIGVFAFLGWTLFTFRLALRTAKQAESLGLFYYSDLAWGLFTALVLLHFNGLTNVTFWEGKVMHQQMLAVGFLFIIQKLLIRKKA